MRSEKIVLAITGLPGSGKTEATQYIMEKTGWPKVYFGKTVFDECSRRRMEPTEENQKTVREDLRKIHGMGAMAILNLPEIKQKFESSSVLLESFYSWEEYLVCKKEFGDNFKVLAIYASPEVRQERLANRPERPLTAEQFEWRDYAQIENAHQAGPIARADFMVINEGSIEAFKAALDKLLQIIP